MSTQVTATRTRQETYCISVKSIGYRFLFSAIIQTQQTRQPVQSTQRMQFIDLCLLLQAMLYLHSPQTSHIK